MRGRLGFLLLAFVLAVTSWYMVLGREKVDVWVEVPVALTGMPADMTVISGLQNQVSVRIRGPKGLMRTLTGRVLAYDLDASSFKPGENVITLEPGGLALPNSFEVAELNPSVMVVQADKVVTKDVGVLPAWAGDVPDSFELADAVFSPPTVVLRGAQRFLKDVDNVAIVPLSVNGTVFNSTVAVSGETPLVLPQGVESRPGVVTARLIFDWRKVDKWTRVNVEVEGPVGAVARVSPSRVRVQARVPLPRAEAKDGLDGVHAVAVVPEEAEPGKHEVPLVVEVPGGKAVRVEPDVVTVTIDRK